MNDRESPGALILANLLRTDLQSARLENVVDSSWSGDACGVYGNRTTGKLVVELDLISILSNKPSNGNEITAGRSNSAIPARRSSRIRTAEIDSDLLSMVEPLVE